MLDHATEPGRQAMGVFRGSKLIAYATLKIRDRTVLALASKFDPGHAKDYPMYGLLFTIANHYLGRCGMAEVDCGNRALRHDTAIGDFLVRLGYRRQYCRLGLYLVPSVRTILGALAPFRKVVPSLLPSRHAGAVRALLLAREIARATAPNDDST
jgi:hypothetical protein